MTVEKLRKKIMCCDNKFLVTSKGSLSGYRTTCESCGFNKYGRDFDSEAEAMFNFSIKLWNHSSDKK